MPKAQEPRRGLGGKAGACDPCGVQIDFQNTGAGVSQGREPKDIQKKTCPRCRQETYAVLLTCPACGFEWPDLQALGERPAREPGRRMLLGLMIALFGLLGAFCLLYVLLLSFAKRAP